MIKTNFSQLNIGDEFYYDSLLMIKTDERGAKAKLAFKDSFGIFVGRGYYFWENDIVDILEKGDYHELFSKDVK